MSSAYVDTSCMVALAFGDIGAERAVTATAAALHDRDVLLSATLLEAELRAAARRERRQLPAELLQSVAWVVPDRPLHLELGIVLAAGYLRGAELWHVACALYVAPNPAELDFLTLDRRQAEIAAAVGLSVPELAIN